jgi:hypothetical protein
MITESRVNRFDRISAMNGDIGLRLPTESHRVEETSGLMLEQCFGCPDVSVPSSNAKMNGSRDV